MVGYHTLSRAYGIESRVSCRFPLAWYSSLWGVNETCLSLSGNTLPMLSVICDSPTDQGYHKDER